MDILTKILNHKRSELPAWKDACSVDELRERVSDLPSAPSFRESMESVPVGLIAEVKHRSPSAGVIRAPFVPGDIARAYERAGAQAVSCLMDEEFFGGGADHFEEVRSAISLPMLYKEFVVDDWQIWHARAIGASVVLLIAAALPEVELGALMQTAEQAGLDVLFEVHDAAEMTTARNLSADIVGINNRNLKTFVTALETTRDLADKAPQGAMLISESGIRTHEDVRAVQAMGAQGVLVGEHLLRKDRLEDAVRSLMIGG